MLHLQFKWGHIIMDQKEESEVILLINVKSILVNLFFFYMTGQDGVSMTLRLITKLSTIITTSYKKKKTLIITKP